MWQGRSRLALAAIYLVAGILHIVLPGPFLGITPSWVPHATDVIFWTGVCEIAGAVGLMSSAFRRYAAFGLALYAICVFPANVKHAIDSLGTGTASPALWLYHVVRLPLQPILIWLALFAGDLTTWPFKADKTEPS